MQIENLWIKIILAIILIVAVFLRFYNLAEQSLWIDEGFSINAVLAILEKGLPILDSGKVYSAYIYGYATAAVANLWGANIWTYRFWPAVFGVVFVYVVYLIGRQFFTAKIGLLAAFFTAFSYWQIAWSRQARWYTMFSVFLWLALLFFYKFLQSGGKKKRLIYGALSFVFTLLAGATHQLGYLLPLIFLIMIMIMTFRKPYFLLVKKLNVVLAFCLAVLVFDSWFLGSIGSFLKEIKIGNYLPYYLDFTFRNYWLFILLAMLEAVLSWKKKEMGCWLMVGAPFFIYLLFLGFFSNLIQYRYLFHVYPVLFILGASGLAFLADLFEKNWQKMMIYGGVLVLFFGGGQGAYWPKDFYFLEADAIDEIAAGGANFYVYTPQPDFNRAYAYILNHKKPEDIIIAAYPQFNKIFLGEAGYWLKHNLSYWGEPAGIDEQSDTEYYVAAKVIDDLDELKKIMKENSGFIALDFMSLDGRIDKEIWQYINQKAKLVFYDKKNHYSQIWVYGF